MKVPLPFKSYDSDASELRIVHVCVYVRLQMKNHAAITYNP